MTTPHSDLLYAEQGKRDIEDLLVQAERERSHFYTASVLRNTRRLIAAYEERITSVEGQLVNYEKALQYCIDHVESLGYSASAAWMREVQEVCRGERTWEQAGVMSLETDDDFEI